MKEDKSEIQSLTEQIKSLSICFEDIKKFLTRQTDERAIPKGNVETKKYKNYYDVSDTINAALATPATGTIDPDSSSYNTEDIYKQLGRYGEAVKVSNDGSVPLFVIISHGGETNLSREIPIYPGENKTYYNVYQLLLRSTVAGHPYRVTEYPICCSMNTGTSSRGSPLEAAINITGAGDNTVIAAPAAGLRIKIVNIFFICTVANTVTLKSGAATNLTGAMAFAANGGMGFNGDFNPLILAVAQAFVINLTAGSQVSGFVLYYVE